MTNKKPLQFNREFQRIEMPDPYFIGPLDIVHDHRIIAGLLFNRGNGGTHREVALKKNELSCPLTITYVRDFSPNSSQILHVSTKAVIKLLEEGYLQGKACWGYTDHEQLHLNDSGQREVVTEWFTTSDVMDHFAAGRSYNMHTQEWSW